VRGTPFHVFLNGPGGELDPAGPYFVGWISFFGTADADGLMHDHGGHDVSFDVAEQVHRRPPRPPPQVPSRPRSPASSASASPSCSPVGCRRVAPADRRLTGHQPATGGLRGVRGRCRR
jgi:tyrosinase